MVAFGGRGAAVSLLCESNICMRTFTDRKRLDCEHTSLKSDSVLDLPEERGPPSNFMPPVDRSSSSIASHTLSAARGGAGRGLRHRPHSWSGKEPRPRRAFTSHLLPELSPGRSTYEYSTYSYTWLMFCCHLFVHSGCVDLLAMCTLQRVQPQV